MKSRQTFQRGISTLNQWRIDEDVSIGLYPSLHVAHSIKCVILYDLIGDCIRMRYH